MIADGREGTAWNDLAWAPRAPTPRMSSNEANPYAATGKDAIDVWPLFVAFTRNQCVCPGTKPATESRWRFVVTNVQGSDSFARPSTAKIVP